MKLDLWQKYNTSGFYLSSWESPCSFLKPHEPGPFYAHFCEHSYLPKLFFQPPKAFLTKSSKLIHIPPKTVPKAQELYNQAYHNGPTSWYKFFVLVNFLCCDKIVSQKQIKRGRIYFGSQVSGRYSPSWQEDMAIDKESIVTGARSKEVTGSGAGL